MIYLGQKQYGKFYHGKKSWSNDLQTCIYLTWWNCIASIKRKNSRFSSGSPQWIPEPKKKKTKILGRWLGNPGKWDKFPSLWVNGTPEIVDSNKSFSLKKWSFRDFGSLNSLECEGSLDNLKFQQAQNKQPYTTTATPLIFYSEVRKSSIDSKVVKWGRPRPCGLVIRKGRYMHTENAAVHLPAYRCKGRCVTAAAPRKKRYSSNSRLVVSTPFEKY